MTDKTIFIFDAQEGDKLADDVHTPDGNILAKKDTILNYDIIANISCASYTGSKGIRHQ